MTDVLEREQPPRRQPAFETSNAARVLLASLSAGAGVIHLAMAPSHSGESTIEGLTFLASGFVQIALAALLLTRSSRLLLRITLLVNLAFIGVWAMSRVWGLPYGAHAWHPEQVSSVDLACVAIEGMLVLACGAVLTNPALGRAWNTSRIALGAVIPIGVLALVGAILVSPGARNHAHGSHGDHGETADGHAHGAEAAGADGHAHEVTEDDLGFSALQNGHQHGSGEIELDARTQAALDKELDKTRALIDRYPTIAAAEAAGYRRAGPYMPGLGTHYFKVSGFVGESSDALEGSNERMVPLLIFDGLGQDAPLAGFMYLAGAGQAAAEEPVGFVGPNDHWHYHTNTCIVYGPNGIEAPFGADRDDITQAQCSQFGGELIANTGYMVHVWTVPGYESELGVFSELNPKLTCADGTYYIKPISKLGFSPTMCRSANLS
jgi:hypothetical protein